MIVNIKKNITSQVYTVSLQVVPTQPDSDSENIYLDLKHYKSINTEIKESRGDLY